MRPGILLRFSLDFLGIGLLEKDRQLGAELWEMIKQLRIGKIVRSRNVRVPIDCGDPGLENSVPMGEYKIAKTGDCSDRRPALTVTSDERNPPNLISEANTYLALQLKDSHRKNSKPTDGFRRFVVGRGKVTATGNSGILIRSETYGVRKILPV